MKGLLVFLLLILVLTRCSDKKPTFEAPILKNIGDYVKVTTNSEYSQLFFNQGVIMANGFNDREINQIPISIPLFFLFSPLKKLHQ